MAREELGIPRGFHSFEEYQAFLEGRGDPGPCLRRDSSSDLDEFGYPLMTDISNFPMVGMSGKSPSSEQNQSGS